MRRLGLLLGVMAAILVGVVPVQAHFLLTDGAIGAVLHVEPGDDPVAGEPSSFFFEFKDKQGKFQADQCDCVFNILEGDKEVYTQPLFQNTTDPSLQNASVFYVFPQRGVYAIKVVGQPKQSEAFQPFILTHVIRVEKVTAATSVKPHASKPTPWLLNHSLSIGVMVGLGLLSMVVIVSKYIAPKNTSGKGGGKDEKTSNNIY